MASLMGMGGSTGPDTTLRFRLLKKQAEFIRAQEREVLYSGAYGAAKSTGLCLKLLVHAAVPGNYVGLGRKTMPALKSSTLRTLIDGDSCMPPILPRDSSGTPLYNFNRSEAVISLYGGGRIKLFSMDEEVKLRSHAFGAIGIDEASEFTESEWNTLLGRIRLPIYEGHPTLRNQLFGCTNPDSPTHFLYRRFFGPDAKANSRRAITTKSWDNPYLIEGYREWLGSLTGQQRDRFVEGKWVSFGGAFYDNFSRDTHVIPRDFGELQTFWAGIDDGCVHPACILVAGEDHDGNIHVCQEWYERGHTHAEIAERAESAYQHYGIEGFAVDPAAAGLREELYRRNLPVIEAANDRFQTSRTLYDMLSKGPAGKPRLTIEPTVSMLPLELESIEPHATKNEPRKTSTSDGSVDPRTGEPIAGGMDHAHDALRYLLSALPQLITGRELWVGGSNRYRDKDGWDFDD